MAHLLYLGSYPQADSRFMIRQDLSIGDSEDSNPKDLGPWEASRIDPGR